MALMIYNHIHKSLFYSRVRIPSSGWVSI